LTTPLQRFRAPQQTVAVSLNRLVGGGQQRFRDGEAEGLSALEKCQPYAELPKDKYNKHAFGGLSVRFFRRSKREKPADSAQRLCCPLCTASSLDALAIDLFALSPISA
jgi:hypothetical protein